MHHYCTFFDQHFIPYALGQLASLKRHARPFKLYCLCLDEAAYQFVVALNDCEAEALRVGDLEQYFPRLLEAKANRSAIEYYFTLKPVLPLYLLRTRADIETLAYFDADVMLFSSASPLFDELGSGSFLLLRHHFEGPDKKAEERGHYCAGAFLLRRSPQLEALLAWWHERCLEWCKDHYEDGKYADQKYMDMFEQQFEGVVVCRKIHGHVGPWNLQLSNRLSRAGGRFFFGENELILFHFHGVRIIRPWLIDCGMTYSNLRWNRALTALYHQNSKALFTAISDHRLKDAALGHCRSKESQLGPIDYLLTRRCFVLCCGLVWDVYLLPLRNLLLRLRPGK
jgi:hypothetical protein